MTTEDSQLTGHSLRVTTGKYAWDGMGGKYVRDIPICDHNGQLLPNACSL